MKIQQHHGENKLHLPSQAVFGDLFTSSSSMTLVFAGQTTLKGKKEERLVGSESE
jgi:hypothetical protein